MKRKIGKVWASWRKGAGSDPLAAFLADGTLVMGEHSYGSPRIRRHRGDQNKVVIGKFCSIASDVTIFVGGNHRLDWVSTYPFRIKFDLPGKYADGHPASRGDVVIGSDVWIGHGATILSGVRVGHGAAIAAESLVTKDVPPYSVVGGNPAQLIKQRFSDAQVEALLEIAWWEWPLEKILKFTDRLCDGDIDLFIRRAREAGR